MNKITPFLWFDDKADTFLHLHEMLKDKDAEKSQRVMKATLQMDKHDINTLKQAYEQQ